MGSFDTRAAPGAQLSTTALIAILTGVGVVVLGLVVGLVVSLIRAIRTHRRLLVDLEERGVVLAQAHAQESKRDSVTRPRAVLRRNTILPYGAKSGWGALPSVETINPPEAPSIPPHYVPPKPVGFSNRPSRLSWSFTARRVSGKVIHMRKIRVPTLSTVIESPKPSPLVPILNRPPGGDQQPSDKSGSRPSSDQSLLQHHPAFRNTRQERPPQNTTASQQESLRRSASTLTAKPAYKSEIRVRPNRSKSEAEVPTGRKGGATSRVPPLHRHSRSASMCSQASGTAPEVPIPPLPLEVARIKSQERGSLLSRCPSRTSNSSSESVSSSILVTQSSPVVPRSRNLRVQAVSKRDWRNSMIVGPRPVRDVLTSDGTDPRSRSSIKSTAARYSLASPSTAGQPKVENRSSTITNSSSMQSIKVKTAESVTLSKVSSPSCSPLTVRSRTPRRRSGCSVTAYGSPEERPKASTIQNVYGNQGIPERQLSQASTQASSTRSSNGNPFHWDPAPLSSGKPSALKGSPSARKGHRRQNTVRISLAPTILGPRSRSPSPSMMNDIQEESPNLTSEKRSSVSNTRFLPRPPSCSTFAPELKLTSTSIRASLTPSSPTLSLAPYDQGPTGFAHEKNRMSVGTISLFSIPSFPSPCHDIPSLYMGAPDSNASAPPTFELSRPSNEYGDELRAHDSPMAPSSPFETLIPNFNDSETPRDEYDPERPGLVCQTPGSNSVTRNFSSPFSIIAEESSATARQTENYEQLEDHDSPPCSPKTLRPNSSLFAEEDNFAHYSAQSHSLPEESFLDTIDPAVLRIDAFSTLDGDFNTSTSMMNPSDYKLIPLPTSPRSAKTMLEPLLEAAFASSPPQHYNAAATYLSIESSAEAAQSAPSSTYSSPPQSPNLASPSSPRPGHAQLPAATPSLNFADMPTLNPSPCGPRGSPPRPLRSSIAKLRRMNSDAEKAGKDKAGRGERRYLRLGREDSIALPGEESFLDDLEDAEEGASEGSLNEAKSRRLVGDLLDWEEEATMLDLDEDKSDNNSCNLSTQTDDTDSNKKRDTSTTTTSFSSPRPDLNNRSSSIWEDGEKFWHSTPPRNSFMPISSSPLAIPPIVTSPNRKRHFEVAKDSTSPTQVENKPFESASFSPPFSPSTTINNDSNGNSNNSRKAAGNRYRKRSVLGNTTPNMQSKIRILIQPPSGSFSNVGTPGSLYDADGFLRA